VRAEEAATVDQLIVGRRVHHIRINCGQLSPGREQIISYLPLRHQHARLACLRQQWLILEDNSSRDIFLHLRILNYLLACLGHVQPVLGQFLGQLLALDRTLCNSWILQLPNQGSGRVILEGIDLRDILHKDLPPNIHRPEEFVLAHPFLLLVVLIILDLDHLLEQLVGIGVQGGHLLSVLDHVAVVPVRANILMLLYEGLV